MRGNTNIRNIKFTQLLQDEDAMLLHKFLNNDEEQDKGKKVKKFNQDTKYTHKDKDGDTTFTLSHSLVRITQTQPTSTAAMIDRVTKKKSYSYAVFDELKNNPIGEGGFGRVYLVYAELKHKDNKMECQAFEKKQVVKISDFKVLPAATLNIRDTTEESEGSAEIPVASQKNKQTEDENNNMNHSASEKDDSASLEESQKRQKRQRETGINAQQQKERDKRRSENKLMLERATHFGAKKMTIQKKGDRRIRSYIVSDLLPGTRLDKLHATWKTNPPTLLELFQLSISLLQALETQMSNQQIAHRDIKPENIMVDTATRPWTVNIMDLGESTLIGSDTPLGAGSELWLAPEAGDRKLSVNTAASDTYSMGWVIRYVWDDARVSQNQAVILQGLHGKMLLMYAKNELAKHPEKNKFTMSTALRDACVAQRVSYDVINKFEEVITDITCPNYGLREKLNDAITALGKIAFTPIPEEHQQLIKAVAMQLQKVSTSNTNLPFFSQEILSVEHKKNVLTAIGDYLNNRLSLQKLDEIVEKNCLYDSTQTGLFKSVTKGLLEQARALKNPTPTAQPQTQSNKKKT